MYSRIELEKVKLEAEEKTSVNSRVLLIIFFYLGFLGIPFFFLKSYKRGFFYLGTTIILGGGASIFLDYKNTSLFWLIYSTIYLFDFTFFYISKGFEKKQKLKKRFEFIEEKMLNKEDDFNKEFDNEINLKIIDFDIKNPKKDPRVASFFYICFPYLGISSFYLKKNKIGIITIILFLIALIVNSILLVNAGRYMSSSESAMLLITPFILFAFSLYQAFQINTHTEDENKRIRKEKKLMLLELEESYNKGKENV